MARIGNTIAHRSYRIQRRAQLLTRSDLAPVIEGGKVAYSVLTFYLTEAVFEEAGHIVGYPRWSRRSSVSSALGLERVVNTDRQVMPGAWPRPTGVESPNSPSSRVFTIATSIPAVAWYLSSQSNTLSSCDRSIRVKFEV